MAKTENKKVPGALIAIVAVIVAVAVFVPTVYMPYKNKKPIMDSEHQEAMSTIDYYEQSIERQSDIEKDIEKLTKQWEEFQKDMFVDANSSLEDLQKSIDEKGIVLTSFTRSAEMPDENGKYSFTGCPLYYVSIQISGYASRENLLDFLKKIEQESVGCYYVKTINAFTVTSDMDVGKSKVKKDDLMVNLDIYLYYYNQDPALKVEIATETDTETESE